jgi:hypothetical protein
MELIMIEQITNEAWVFLIWSAFYSTIGGILIGISHDIKGKTLPAFEVESKQNRQEGMVQTKRNTHERGFFIFACALLSGVIGFMIGLYFLGFMAKEDLPNIYQLIFIGISEGFLIPKIL